MCVAVAYPFAPFAQCVFQRCCKRL
jgi:hypothetical protein